MNNNDTKDLSSILRDLVEYCALNTGGKVNIEIKLPKTIMQQFSNGFYPVSSEEPVIPHPWIDTYHVVGGIITFLK